MQRASRKAPPGDVCGATGLLRLTPPASTWNPRHMGVGQDVREPSQPPGNNDLEGKWKMTVIPERRSEHGMNKELRRMLTVLLTNRIPPCSDEHHRCSAPGQAAPPRMSSLSVPSAEVSSAAYHSQHPCSQKPLCLPCISRS